MWHTLNYYRIKTIGVVWKYCTLKVYKVVFQKRLLDYFQKSVIHTPACWQQLTIHDNKMRLTIYCITANSKYIIRYYSYISLILPNISTNLIQRIYIYTYLKYKYENCKTCECQNTDIRFSYKKKKIGRRGGGPNTFVFSENFGTFKLAHYFQ